MCQKSHKSFQRTTGQTTFFIFVETDGLGVTSCLIARKQYKGSILWKKNLGPISSTSLRRVFVLKTSYEVRTLKIGFHQTIELCELLTFSRIFKTNI